MGMKKRTFRFSMVFILVLAMFMPAGLGSGNTDPAFAVGLESEGHEYIEDSYGEYLSAQGYEGNMASSEVKVDVTTFKAIGGMEAVANGNAVATGEQGAIEWSFQVKEAGFYNISLTYIPLKGTNSKIERRLLIDHESYFKGMNQLVFNRVWDNSNGEEIMERNGNEIRPLAVEKPQLTTVYIGDAQKRNLEPYKFYFSAGTHTITLESVKEPMEIHELTLKTAPEVRPYEEVLSEWKQKYDVYSNENLTYQAERIDGNTLAIEKSSVDITMATDYSNPNTEPYHPYNIKLNAIGGPNWRTPGDYIEWKINVPEEGLYQLSFRGVQNTNRGVMSYRQLRINGEVPYREAMAVPFAFHSGFVNYIIGQDDEEYLVLLHEGENTISLEVVLGEFAMPLSEVEKSVYVLNDLYRKTVQITGLVPDQYIDYEITKKIPDYAELFQAESERLKRVVDELVRITGEKGEKTAMVEKMQVQAAGIAAKPDTVIKELGTLANNISSLGTWITSISEMPLQLDSFTLYAPDSKLKKAKPNFFVSAYNSVVRFLSTFFVDETEMFGDSSEDAITVWVSSGRDQAQIIKDLIDQKFTPQSNIPVNLMLIPEDVILPATLAGNGPDVALSIPQAMVVNFAMRNALTDLSKLEGYNALADKFYDSALRTVTFQEGVYALPEQQTFLMMFYRDDILKQLELTQPKTWDDVEHMIAVLHANNYDFYIPGQELVPSMVFQYGGDLFKGEGNDYGIESALTEDNAMNAFSRVTRFFTSYRLPVSADFPNRFRTGEMPAGIAQYTTYNQLEVFAPEIRGQWSFSPLPGIEQEDGTINNQVVSSTINTVLLDDSDNKEAAWEFMQWWLATDTQTEYANALEAIMGSAARYPTANVEVLDQLPWSIKDAAQIKNQFEATVGVPEVPGGYMTTRAIDYAFRGVVTSGESPREALYLNNKQIDKELTKKRQEFHLSYISSD